MQRFVRRNKRANLSRGDVTRHVPRPGTARAALRDDSRNALMIGRDITVLHVSWSLL